MIGPKRKGGRDYYARGNTTICSLSIVDNRNSCHSNPINRVESGSWAILGSTVKPTLVPVVVLFRKAVSHLVWHRIGPDGLSQLSLLVG